MFLLLKLDILGWSAINSVVSQMEFFSYLGDDLIGKIIHTVSNDTSLFYEMHKDFYLHIPTGSSSRLWWKVFVFL